MQVQLAALLDELSKVAGMNVDLRTNGIGGVQRPSFPVEPSKSFASNQLNNSQKVGKFTGADKPSTLVKPGPSIPQIAPKVG